MRFLRSCVLAFLPLCALWAQPRTTYQGKPVVANDIILRLKASDSATLARISAFAVAGEQFQSLSKNLPIHLLHSNSRALDVLEAAIEHSVAAVTA
jgi:hypothetical protein